MFVLFVFDKMVGNVKLLPAGTVSIPAVALKNDNVPAPSAPGIPCGPGGPGNPSAPGGPGGPGMGWVSLGQQSQ